MHFFGLFFSFEKILIKFSFFEPKKGGVAYLTLFFEKNENFFVKKLGKKCQKSTFWKNFLRVLPTKKKLVEKSKKIKKI